MSYNLNKTDGTLLTELVDGVLDTNTTDISLVGRNYSGYGEFINENFIRMLENFANPNSPVTPLKGQLWYDTSESKLKVFDGTDFQSAAGSFISETFPSGPVAGDTWFSTDNKQFYLYDGTTWTLIGPAYSRLQGQSGVITDTIFDTDLNSKTVLKIFVNEILQAVISGETFTPNPVPNNIVSGLVSVTNATGTIFKGVNLIDKVDFKFRGVATSAENLISSTNEIVPESKLMKNDSDQVLNGKLNIRNSGGVSVGVNDDTRLFMDNGFTIRNTRSGDSFNIVVRGANDVLDQTNAFTIKPNTKRIGLFNANPAYNLDVTGDMRVTGNLTVEGDSFVTEAETLQVADKNIELGVVASPTNLTADQGGITLKGTTDKTFEWLNISNSWTSSEHLDLVSTKNYKINNTDVLSSDTLGAGVINTSIRNLGVLETLNIGTGGTASVNISNAGVITRPGASTGLTFTVGGDINVSSSKITNLLTPTSDADAVNKVYVDQTVQSNPIIFSMDITGMVSIDDEIITILNSLYPSSTFANGKVARIATTNYTGQTTDPIDIATPTTTTEVDVNAAAGGTVSVLQGISLPNSLTPTFTLSVTRGQRNFIITNGAWVAN
ncbi:MAG: hypothetical protein ACKVJK_00335 [Methylophagaceae bacterium]|jgi:hypothetical protein|tara:strand:+ start:1665 stop:3491 length:1827 start_codon:yes stop_codon:yes gene_type:complete